MFKNALVVKKGFLHKPLANSVTSSRVTKCHGFIQPLYDMVYEGEDFGHRRYDSGI